MQISNPSFSPICLSRKFKIALICAALWVSGCSDGSKTATQIVAKVNGDEISVHQVNNAVAQMPSVAPENLELARREVLAKLVNQQLAVQEAVNMKLDRSPAVMMQIDSSKREILARAYLNQVVTGLPKPTTEDVKKFFDEHPALFNQRRIYVLQEIALQNPHPPLAELKKIVAGKSMGDIATEFKQQNILYAANAGTRAAEQIPLPMLEQLSSLEDGQTGVIEMPQSVAIVHVEASKLAPVKEELAMQAIPQYLINERARLAINDNLERLKNTSRIEYMNGADKVTPAVTASITATPEVAVKSGNTSNSTERGIAGIK